MAPPNALADLFGISALEHGSSASTSALSYPQRTFAPRGHVIPNLAKDRLRAFTSTGQFQDVNLQPLMYDGRESAKEYVTLEVASPPGLSRPPFHEAIQLPFRPCSKGESFGPSWSTHWFRVTLKIPSKFLNKERIEFHWDCEGEGMIWTTGGVPMQGLTGGGGGDRRVEYILPKEWRDEPDSPHTFYIEASMNGMFGCADSDSIQPPNPNRYFSLKTAEIVIPYMPAWHLFWDYWIITDCARELGGWEEQQALTIATEIVNTFRRDDRSSIDKCLKIAEKFLGKHTHTHKIYDGDAEDVLVTGIGHCHIDTAWLWPFDETKRKVARSWATQVDLMDRYEEHRFACSQGQQWKWLEQYYPLLFEKVKRKVEAGKFIPIGGTWVEMDTNMPSGEALVRQCMYGQRFFESRFGFRCKTFWLPDTFGYSAQLPQIARSAGMQFFFTQKLSWNNINKFPNTTFNWVALDGTQVICHMCPSETYNAQCNVGDVIRSVSQHKNLTEDNTSLLVFGNGDGGGGPLAQMLEKLRRCRGVSDTIGRLPKVTMGSTVDQFFERIEKKTDHGKKLVSWHGELYFELHRGTYTSQAHTKRNNRYSEVMLKDLEYLATLASIHTKGYTYPKKDLDEMWENVLLCQFHDVLPGSSIEMVYDDASHVFATGHKLVSEALSALGVKESSTKDDKVQVAINTLPWPRSEIVTLKHGDGEGAQKAGNKQFAIAATDAYGTTVLDPVEIQLQMVGKGATITEKDGIFILANGKLQVTIQGGQILSLLDIEADRELIPKGEKANRLILYDDQPLYWDAWDVELYHLETPVELGMGKTRITEAGPLRVGLEVQHQISERSWIKTTITLDAYIPSDLTYGEGFKDPLSYLQFDCEVDWHENRRFLKAEFPVDIYSDTASYECQFGIVKRPTHYNTTWDHAKFEVVCHKWADLSEFGYGVSILNDSKYGFATLGNVMRLSLLRSSKAPDGHADMGRHHIRYALLPHRGALCESAVVRAGHNFNHPLRVGHVSSVTSAKKVGEVLESIQISGSPNVILDTIKRGEDDHDVTSTPIKKRDARNVVLRVYEAYGGKGKATISTSLPVKKAFQTNILEDDGDEIDVVVSQRLGKKTANIDITLRPFEVATLRLEI